MHQLRLIGLVLFITTTFLAMAAAVTQTTHIRFKRPPRDANGNLIDESLPATNQPTQVPQEILPPATAIPNPSTANMPLASSPSELQFVAVPVIYPLLVAGTLGLMLWFVPAPRSNSATKKRKRRR